MQFRLFSVLLTAGFVLSLPALAQPEPLTIGDSAQDIVFEMQPEGGGEPRRIYLYDKMRGAVTVFYFFSPRDLESLAYLDDIRLLRAKYRTQGVEFMGITRMEQKKFEEAIRERNVEWQGAFSEMYYGFLSLHYRFGGLAYPYVVIFNPQGELIYRGFPSDLDERIGRYVQIYDPPRGDPAWFQKQFQLARQKMSQGEFGEAFWRARRLSKVTDESNPLHSQATTLMEEAKAKADEWLREAVSLEREGKYEEAARIVANIAIRFQDPEKTDNERDRGNRDRDRLSIERKAELEIGRMNSRRELKQEIRDARKNEEAWIQLDIAREWEDVGRYIDAFGIYDRVAKQFEDLPAAEEAEKRMERITNDDQIQRAADQERAVEQSERWYDIAERLADAKLYGMAKDYLDRLMDEYPDSAAARRAKQGLAERITSGAESTTTAGRG